MQDLPQDLQRAFDPDGDFRPVQPPRPGDWLAVHPERGQAFEDFIHAGSVRHAGFNRPDTQRHRIYLQPIGEFPAENAPNQELLKKYVSAFFNLEAVILPLPGSLSASFTTRRNPASGQTQYLTTDILNALKIALPADAFCSLAISMVDLFPSPSWNFVFGQASLYERVGVYSFARYNPAFYGQPSRAGDQKLILKRSCKVLAHETSHMFGLEHCIYFQCLLNGSNHLEESDARPMHVCPIDLRKLYSSIGFDISTRYTRLAAFYRKVGFVTEAEWVESRIEKIQSNPHSPIPPSL